MNRLLARSRLFVPLLLLLGAPPVQVASQVTSPPTASPPPATPTTTAPTTITLPQVTQPVAPGTAPNTTVKELVNLAFSAAMGPLGFIPGVMPASTARPSADPLQESGLIFPSIYFYFSASPVNPDLLDPEMIRKTTNKAGETDARLVELDPKDSRILFAARDLDWMSVHVKLQPRDANNEEVSCKDVRILDLLPDSTISEAREGAIQKAATTVAGVFAATPVTLTAKGASQSFAVFFNNLMKPKPVAYQYAELESSCHFGWYFRRSENVSLLGVQRGVVLLSAPNKIKSFDITVRIITRWTATAFNPEPKRSNNQNELAPDTKSQPVDPRTIAKEEMVNIPVPQDVLPGGDLDSLQELTNLPLVISVGDVVRILHANSTADVIKIGWDATDAKKAADAGHPLVLTPGEQYVTKGSLQKYLDATSTEAQKATPDTPDGGPTRGSSTISPPH